MKMLKYILLLLAGLACFACSEDEGNPPFADDELYIYDQTAESLTAVVGQEFKLSLIVSPNDGSVECTWLLDEQAIGNSKDLVYTFYPIRVLSHCVSRRCAVHGLFRCAIRLL